MFQQSSQEQGQPQPRRPYPAQRHPNMGGYYQSSSYIAQQAIMTQLNRAILPMPSELQLGTASRFWSAGADMLELGLRRLMQMIHQINVTQPEAIKPNTMVMAVPAQRRI